MNEKTIMHRVMKAVSDVGVTIFRNHVGLSYQGKAIRLATGFLIHAEKGDILIKNARVMKAGLIVGSSDLIGWRPYRIRQRDVGKTFAQFVAIETKSDDGKITKEQRQFLMHVNDDGGIGIEAKSAEEAVEKLKGERP